MKRNAMNLVGGLAGLMTGWALMPYPVSALFAATQVNWDGSNCPAGIYTVTSTAQIFGGTDSYVATSTNVALPRASVVQEFANLPPGTYSVTASVQSSDGQTLVWSSPAIIESANSAAASGSSGSPGRRRPASSPSIGVAQPRRAAAATSTSASRSAAPQVAQPAASTPIATTGRGHRAADVIATDADWRRVDIVDSDGDGVVDLVTVEMANGDTYVWDVTGAATARGPILVSRGRVRVR